MSTVFGLINFYEWENSDWSKIAGRLVTAVVRTGRSRSVPFRPLCVCRVVLLLSWERSKKHICKTPVDVDLDLIMRYDTIEYAYSRMVVRDFRRNGGGSAQP